MDIGNYIKPIPQGCILLSSSTVTVKNVQRATLCLHEDMGQLREDMQRLQEDVERDIGRLRGNVSCGPCGL